jgi:hypothetical protein
MKPTKLTKRRTATPGKKAAGKKTPDRVVRRIEDLDEETIRAIEKAAVPARFAYLDKEFGLETPNAETRAAMRESRALMKKDIPRFYDVDALINALDASVRER